VEHRDGVEEAQPIGDGDHVIEAGGSLLGIAA
jgi:hypothetical protein